MTTISNPIAGTQPAGITTTQLGEGLPSSTAPGTSAGNLTDAALPSMAPQSTAPDQAGAVKDKNGAPALPFPTTDFNADDLSLLLQYFTSMSEHAQLEAQKGVVQISSDRTKEAQADQQKKLEKWIKDCESAAKSRGLGKIFGWIAKGLALVASAIALTATAGAAAPLVAVAVIGAVGALMSLTNDISQAVGGPELTLSNGLSQLSTLILTSCGVPEETAQKWGKLIGASAPMLAGAGVLYLLEPQLLTTAIGGFMELLNASEEAITWVSMAVGITFAIGTAVVMAKLPNGPVDTISKFQELIGDRVMSAMKAGVSIAQAGTTMTEGGIAIHSAFQQKNADNALADKKDLDAFIARLSQIMEETREDIKSIIEQIQDAALLISKILNEHSETTLLISSRLARTSA